METFEPSEPRLQDYWAVLVRRRWIFLGFFLTVLLITALVSFLTTPIYKASTTIQIEEKKGPSFSLSPIPTLTALPQVDPLRTEQEIIKSRTLAEKVAERLGLTEGRDLQAVVDDLRKRLIIEPVRNTNLLKISLEDVDPDRAALTLNTLTGEYIEQNLNLVRREASRAREFVEKQLEALRRDLEERGTTLEQFKSQKGFVTLSDDVARRVDRLSELESQKTLIAMERKELEALAASLQSRTAEGLPKVTLHNPTVGEFARRLMDLQVQRAGLLRFRTPDHPAVIQLDAAVREMEARLTEEIANSRRSLEQREATLDEMIGRYQEGIRRLPGTEKDLANITLSLKTTEEIYTFLLQKEQETRLTEASEVANVRVVDPALPPKIPVKPKKLWNLLMAAVIGLMGGVGTAFFVEYLDSSIKTVEEAQRQLNVPVLGIIPKMRPGEKPEGVNGEPMQAFLVPYQDPMVIESYKSLRTNIEFLGDKRQLLLITSAVQGEGKSLTVANLAILFKAIQSRVLVIDADIRAPRQHSLFGVERERGLTELLTGKNELQDVIKISPIHGIPILPAGYPTPNAPELLTSPRMGELLTELKAHWDLLLLDSPPVIFTDAAILGSKADRVLMVIGAGETPSRHVAVAQQNLKNAKAPLGGAILNKVDVQSNGYYYYHYYNYYYANRSASVKDKA